MLIKNYCKIHYSHVYIFYVHLIQVFVCFSYVFFVFVHVLSVIFSESSYT